TCGVDGFKNYIAGEINTTHFDLYKNNVHQKNLMYRKDTLFNYFDTIDDSNLTVIVYPTTPKLPLANS
ncbi:4471_t:CDS:1, partial [Funneliformis geosporum]